MEETTLAQDLCSWDFITAHSVRIIVRQGSEQKAFLVLLPVRNAGLPELELQFQTGMDAGNVKLCFSTFPGQDEEDDEFDETEGSVQPMSPPVATIYPIWEDE